LILDGSAAPSHSHQDFPAILFPMEKLFESYVGSMIDAMLPPGFRVVSQSTRHHLARKGEKNCFLMKPDFLVRKGNLDLLLVDAKWKIVDAGSSEYDSVAEVAQSDAYQLYAYGRHYLGGRGRMALAYPKTDSFSQATAPFSYDADPDLQVSLIPVDMEQTPQELENFIASALSE
jgi:5-methylcytosine-specific restriction enzyme subunit McrC